MRRFQGHVDNVSGRVIIKVSDVLKSEDISRKPYGIGCGFKMNFVTTLYLIRFPELPNIIWPAFENKSLLQGILVA